MLSLTIGSVAMKSSCAKNAANCMLGTFSILMAKMWWPMPYPTWIMTDTVEAVARSYVCWLAGSNRGNLGEWGLGTHPSDKEHIVVYFKGAQEEYARVGASSEGSGGDQLAGNGSREDVRASSLCEIGRWKTSGIHDEQFVGEAERDGGRV